MNAYFSKTYRDARSLILSRTAKAGGWTHEAHEHPLKDKDGQAIYLDTFWRGPEDAAKVLMICSGTHGVEGFAGSALQVASVETTPNLPDDTAIMLVHGVNPYGFSHLRRVNEDNIDLNRNFIDFGAPRPSNELYKDLYDLLNPVELPEGRIEEIVADLKDKQSKLDFLTFLQAVSGGQYDFPEGMQFGGQSPTWSRRTMESIWQDKLSTAKIVVQIDLHTGLGPSGVGILMMAANDDEPHKAITASWFGDMFVTPRPATQKDVVLGGYMNAGLEESCNAWVIPMTLEYGTFESDHVLQVTIEDNWLVHHGNLESDQGKDIKKRLLEAFYPDTDEWRGAVLARGEEVFAKALSGLSTLTEDDRK